MANSYYVVDLSTSKASRSASVRGALPPGGRRVSPHQLLHWREAQDGSAWLMQADVTADEHVFLTTGARASYITYLGDYIEASRRAEQRVYDYVDANPQIWGPRSA